MPSNMPPPIPRKFSEKIALQKQHEAEGTAEFSRIMAEVSAVTGAQRVSQADQIALNDWENIWMWLVYI
jgi:hypothetical protein